MDKSPDAFRAISEVADWLDTPAHVLRFWESRFTQVKPIKRAGGRRYYRPGDMALLGGIKKLLHEDGMTIRGVQKLLREQGVKYVAGFSQPLDGDAAVAADDSQTTPPIPAAPMAVDVPEGAFDAPAEDETPKVVQFERPSAKTPEPVAIEPETQADVATDAEGAAPPAPVTPPEAPAEAMPQSGNAPEQEVAAQAAHEEQEKEDEKENTVAKSQTASGALPGQTAFDFSALDQAPEEAAAPAAPAEDTSESAPVATTQDVAVAAAADAQPVDSTPENTVSDEIDTAVSEPQIADNAPDIAFSEQTTEPTAEPAPETPSATVPETAPEMAAQTAPEETAQEETGQEEVIAPEPADAAVNTEAQDMSEPAPASEVEESALSPLTDETAEDTAPEREPIAPADAPQTAAPIETDAPEIIDDDPEDDDSAFDAADISALAVLSRQTLARIPAAERAALIARAEALHEKFHSGA